MQLFETDDGYIEWHRFFAQMAFEQDVFNILINILETLSSNSSINDIRQLISTLFDSIFHMIPFNDTIVSTFAAIHSSSPSLSLSFWNKVQEGTSSPSSDLLFSARSRFPLSFLPLLTLLVSSLHPSTQEVIFNYLQSLPTYTQTLQRGFTGYDITQEERDNTLITLRSELQVFAERYDGEGAVIVHSGTVGRLLSRGESVPTVMWEYPYNGWGLLGRVLETVLLNGVKNTAAAEDSNVAVLVNIFRLLQGMMAAEKPGMVENVVTAMSEEMAQEWDVISVTFEIVSQALEVLDLGVQSLDELENLLSIAGWGTKVLSAAVSGREASIWPLIVRGGAKFWGRISRIGISAETSSQVQCMPVTTAAIELVDALFSSTVANAIVSDGFSAHLRREVLWLAGSYVLDIWLLFNDFKYILPDRRFDIGMSFFSALIVGTKLCQLLNRIVCQAYSVDMSHTPENRMTGILSPTADRILEMFLSQENDMNRPFESLFYACYVANEVFDSRGRRLEDEATRKTESWCLSALSLAQRIIVTRSLVRYYTGLLH
jgi:Nucleoporin Nup188, N-terminal subdomain III